MYVVFYPRFTWQGGRNQRNDYINICKKIFFYNNIKWRATLCPNLRKLRRVLTKLFPRNIVIFLLYTISHVLSSYFTYNYFLQNISSCWPYSFYKTSHIVTRNKDLKQNQHSSHADPTTINHRQSHTIYKECDIAVDTDDWMVNTIHGAFSEPVR